MYKYYVDKIAQNVTKLLSVLMAVSYHKIYSLQYKNCNLNTIHKVQNSAGTNPKFLKFEPPELKQDRTLHFLNLAKLHHILKLNFEPRNLTKIELEPRTLIVKKAQKTQFFTNTKRWTFRTSTFTLMSKLSQTRTLQKD